MTSLTLLGLPSELIQHVLLFLQPTDLAIVAQVCRRLNTETHEETLWHREIETYVRASIPKPATVKSFRELYIAHHPNWFLLRKRLWFGDSEPSGKLLVAQYDELTGSIKAYNIVAVKKTHTWTEVDIEHDVVLLHTFDPEVSMVLHRPVLKLNVDSPKADPPNEQLGHMTRTLGTGYGREILMDTATESGLYSSFMLCRKIPEVAISEGTHVWPPQILPAICRTRNASQDGYNSNGHRPSKLSEVSQSNFRLRRWVEYRRSNPSLLSIQPGAHGNSATESHSLLGPQFSVNASGVTIRMPEDVTTYATLPDWCFTPTSSKPWQGIWCGDYSGHGCEFIVIQQPDKDDERPLPRGMDWLQRWFNGDRQWNTLDTESLEVAMEDCDLVPSNGISTSDVPPPESTAEPSGGAGPESTTSLSGRLEAIKLSGDANVPRAQYTFIAPEIGDSGLIRVAHEEPFKGARVVRAAGHIAERGFQGDSYVPSQLFLISNDRLAHYWEEFSSVSYFHRVDLDELVNYGR